MEWDPIKFAQSKTRAQWLELLKGKISICRAWLNESGEKSALYCFIAGIALVLFYKIFIVLFLIAAVIGYGIYYMAPEDKANP